jgi:hypothetical protein
MSLSPRLNFKDLQSKGIVKNRATLRNLIKRSKFPPGKLTGPNSRTWSEEEVEAYVAQCTTDPSPHRLASRVSAPTPSPTAT